MSYTQTSGSVSQWAIDFLERGGYDGDYLCFVDDGITYIIVGKIVRFDQSGNTNSYDSIYAFYPGCMVYKCDNSSGQVDSFEYSVPTSDTVFIYGDAKTYCSLTSDARQVTVDSMKTDLPLLACFVVFSLTCFMLYAWRSFTYGRRSRHVQK